MADHWRVAQAPGFATTRTRREVRAEPLQLAAYPPVLTSPTIMVTGSRWRAVTRISRQDHEASFTPTIADGIDEECAGGACPIR
jgi:hypothetical protein